MKKLILSLILFLAFPIISFAANYDITDYYIESYILENGDLKVRELFVLDGEFNGYERDIIYTNESLEVEDEIDFANSYIYNADGIYDVTIKAKYVSNVNFETFKDTDFQTFEQTHYAYNGESAKYVHSFLDGGSRYRMYFPSDGDKVAFFIEYVVDNAVVIHSDVAELYWNFIGTDYADDISNLNIKVYLPKSDSSSNFRIWAHGDVTGEVNFLEENNQKVGVIATMEKVDAYDAVDIRLTFDKGLITDYSELDVTGALALEKIIEVETERAEVANKLRNELKIKYYIFVIISILYLVALGITFIYVIIKHGLDKKSNFNHEYNREFIDDYNVEVVDYLINRKRITPNAMSASIMNLIYKKNIKAEVIPSDKKEKDYKFILISEDNVNETEKRLIEFLFNKIGNITDTGEKTFTTQELKKYASSSKTCDTFINTYTSWKEMVKVDGEKQGFYENTSKGVVISLLFIVGAVLLNLLGSALNVYFPLVYAFPIISIVFFIYTIINTKRSEKGALHYAKWMAFKRFLLDFGNFSEKELPEITLWERYLVYATVFGIADKVEKAMNVKIKEFVLCDTSSPNVIVYHTHINHAVNRAITHSINSSYERQAANRAAAASKSSSGSGFGGGFSSGGGFGGGGGGGRGF